MRILLATDGSDSARVALDFVAVFPFPAGSEVIMLSVIDWHAFYAETELTDEQSLAFQEMQDVVREDTQRLLAGEGERLRNAGRAGSAEIRQGNPADEIARAAEELGVDLVVLGSHGLSGIKRFLLGSVSDRVLAYASCSVLIVKTPAGDAALPRAAAEQERAGGWRILLAYDNSESSGKALSLCASLPFDDAVEITAVTVMPMVEAFRQDIRQRLNTVWQEKKHAARLALEEAVSTLRRSTSRVSAELREAADVSEEILDIANKSGTDLVMVGSKGQGAIRRFLLGSITNRVARHAHCSVWVVRD